MFKSLILCIKCHTFYLYILGSSPSLAKKIKNKDENIALELTLNTPENIEKYIYSEKEYNWLTLLLGFSLKYKIPSKLAV